MTDPGSFEIHEADGATVWNLARNLASVGDAACVHGCAAQQIACCLA